MDDLTAFELLSLVSKITSELQNHLGINDRTLAEFVIAQHEKCSSIAEFKQSLDAMGAEFPQSLIESIDRLILTMHPKHKNKQNGHKERNGDSTSFDEVDKKERIFKGLAIPDREQTWEEDDLPTEKSKPEFDDTFARLEGLAGSTNQSSRKRRHEGHHDHDRGRDRSSYHRLENHSGGHYGEKRRRSPPDSNFRRPPTPEVDSLPQLYKCYDGVVTGIQDFGAFVNIRGVKGKVDGLVHVSAMQEGARVSHPSDLLSRGQPVKVKVMKIEGTRIGLSMKEVDQVTGRDLAPHRRIASGANMERLNGMSSNDDYGTGVPVIEDDFIDRPKRSKKRLTSPERWEIRQLIASGVASASDYPDLEEEHNAMEENGGLEEDIDIEIRDEEPPFLAGQTKQSLELSPIRIVKAPDGSLNRAAMSGTALAKERRELKQQEAAEKAAEQASRADLSSQWQDPMIAPEHRKFASDLRSVQSYRPAESVPEWKRAALGKDQPLGRRTNLTMKQQREGLPIFKFRKQLLEAIEANRILVVVGDTGSGKSTQMTQYLAEAGYADRGVIGCTQPRRVAAISLAKRVADENGSILGEEIGYTIRFEDRSGPQTRIKYMTDGILLRQLLYDDTLREYSVIILDEAHERSIATDVLFGLMLKTMKKRPDLKLIVTSTTLDADKFSTYFDDAPIFSIPGRTYPVEILYSKEPESDYLDAAITTVMQLHLTEPIEPGQSSILLFLTGQDEIETACEILFERFKALGPSIPEADLIPIYSALPSEMQSRVFEPAPPGKRKVVIATNIAETSLTIDDITYVVDPGFVKESSYDPRTGMDSLVVVPISQAAARQRAGRAGRVGPGKCFRLYTEAAFQSEMTPSPIPEIQRQNLSTTVLSLKCLGIHDLLHFKFMDPPATQSMLTALEELYALGALDAEGLLTRLGRRMGDFPMDPALAKVLIASVELNCSEEMLTIVAMLSVQSVFYRPREKQQQADQKKSKFHDPHGDHLTLLRVYNAWVSSSRSNPWCIDNYIQGRQMRRASDVRTQLVDIMKRHRHQVVSCGNNTLPVRKALCSGLFKNSARKDPQEGYKTLVEGTPVSLHPSSALFGKPVEHVIYGQIVLTSKEYMHNVTAIEPKWLVEAAPTFFKVAPTDRLSKRKKAERIQPLHNKFAGEDDWRLSAQKRQGRGGGGGTWG